MRPVSNKMMRITTSKPEIPLGPYPQFLLWGQEGNAPTRIKISTTSNTVEIVIEVLLTRHPAGLSLKSNLSLCQFREIEETVLWGEHLMR